MKKCQLTSLIALAVSLLALVASAASVMPGNNPMACRTCLD